MNRQQKAGFTVVETMIVLAVSSVLFLSVAALISGQLERFRTRDAVFNLESSVRDVLNDVTTGYYPETGTNPTCNSKTANRGENDKCIIAGKKIQFTATGIEITPIAVASSQTAFPSTANFIYLDSLKETKKYEWGITPLATPTNYVDKTFYVLNKNYNTENSANASGGQSVGIYDGLLQPLSSTNKGLVCFVNGGQNSSITLGANGGLTVNAQIKDTGC